MRDKIGVYELEPGHYYRGLSSGFVFEVVGMMDERRVVKVNVFGAPPWFVVPLMDEIFDELTKEEFEDAKCYHALVD